MEIKNDPRNKHEISIRGLRSQISDLKKSQNVRSCGLVDRLPLVLAGGHFL